MWSSHRKTADPRADWNLNLCPERLFFKRGNRFFLIRQDSGVGMVCQSLNVFHGEILLYQLWLVCRCCIVKKSLIPCMTEVDRAILLHLFSSERTQSLRYSPVMLFPALHNFLPSVAQCHLSKKKNRVKYLLLGSVSSCDFGRVPVFRYPCFVHCSSKVQDNIAMFRFLLSVNRHALCRNLHTSWGAQLNMLSYPSSSGASKYVAQTLR